jgi:hypothetical protein
VIGNGQFELIFSQQTPIDEHFAESFLFFHMFTSILPRS